MSMSLQELKNLVSSLSIGERAELAQFLLHSLDEDEGADVRAEWLALAEQRMAEVRAGKVVGVPFENADLETTALSTNRQFIDLIERARARVHAEGGLSNEEMRRRFG